MTGASVPMAEGPVGLLGCCEQAARANVVITVMKTVRSGEPPDIASIVSYETKGMRVDLCQVARSVVVYGAVVDLRMRGGPAAGRGSNARHHDAGDQRSSRYARRGALG
ncbi:hypothetical protein GCM10022419_048960 [Nonomuraea rosea]|uniref:Uncharacterized protein n=1 Tax=Nonomuraea rosea TaxID=638574 RepID=A0ABP6X835_9ACTN